MKKWPPPFVIKLIIKIWNGLHKLADKLQPFQTRMIMFAISFMRSFAVHTAAELKIADHLKNGSKSIDELAELTSTHPDSLYRLLRALSSEGIFRELPGQQFEPTPESKILMSEAEDTIWPGAMLVGDPTWINSWMTLPYSIQSGKPAFENIYGLKYLSLFYSAEQFDFGYEIGM